MAHIAKYGDKWRAEICVDNKRKAKTFPTKREATAWASEKEESGILSQHTFLEAIERYKPIAEKKKGAQSELSRIKSLSKSKFIYLALDQITPAMIAEYRDNRLKEVAPVSVRREMIVLGAILKKCTGEWGWLSASPLKTVDRPESSKPRRRGITQSEIDTICAKLLKTRTGKPVADMFLFALETAMRLSEICSVRWEDVSEKTVSIPDSKNDEGRIVPLSQKARDIIECRRGLNDEFVFAFYPHVISTRFRRQRINGVHFHDARSEAVTRLSKKLDLMQLAKMIGHRDLKSLLIYYAEPPENIADRL